MSDDPEIDEAIMQEGAASHVGGLPRENCPYPPDSPEREAWLKGWERSFQEQEAFKSNDRSPD